jgi:hypothetical protein
MESDHKPDAESAAAAAEQPAQAVPAPWPLSALSFRIAKTMPEIPHEYVVRSPENEAAYVALFNLIVAHGVHEKWGRQKYQYWYPGDGWKYWRMTNDIRLSRVLNRARAESTQPSA